MTDIPTFDTIKLDIADNVATITLNRPDRLNSMPPTMADDIRGARDFLRRLGARAADCWRRSRLLCGGRQLTNINWHRPFLPSINGQINRVAPKLLKSQLLEIQQQVGHGRLHAFLRTNVDRRLKRRNHQ